MTKPTTWRSDQVKKHLTSANKKPSTLLPADQRAIRGASAPPELFGPTCAGSFTDRFDQGFYPRGRWRVICREPIAPLPSLATIAATPSNSRHFS